MGMAMASVVAFGSPAQAAIISGSYDFTAEFAAGASIAAVSGRITYAFDDSASFHYSQTGFAVTGIPSAMSAKGPGTTYINEFPGFTGRLFFRDRFFTVDRTLLPGTADWQLELVLFFVGSFPPQPGRFACTTLAGEFQETRSIRLTPAAVGVPAPASAALLALGGIGLLGAARARRRS
jgi:hypothetical protein